MKDNCVLIQESTFEKARQKIKENAGKEIIFYSNDDELNRKILEKLPIQIFLINLKNKKDFQKQRDSGFNHVMAKLAQKKNVSIGINLDEIIEAEKNEKQKILARLQQNIKLCNKNKLKMKFIAQNENNQRNIYDLKSLGLVLGMPTWMTRELESDKNLLNQHF